MGTQQGWAARVSGGSPLLMRRAGGVSGVVGSVGRLSRVGEGNVLSVEMGFQALLFLRRPCGVSVASCNAAATLRSAPLVTALSINAPCGWLRR